MRHHGSWDWVPGTGNPVDSVGFPSAVSVGKFRVLASWKPDFMCDTECKLAAKLEKENLGIKLWLSVLRNGNGAKTLVVELAFQCYYQVSRLASEHTPAH